MKKLLKSGIIICIAAGMFACRQRAGSESGDEQDLTAVKATGDTAGVVLPDQLIVPGKRAGKISINGNADSVITFLGKPDHSDAAMGSVLMTWYANHDTSGYKTTIFANHNFGSKDEMTAHIRKILVSSPKFKTADGLNTGLALTEYQKHFTLKPVSRYSANGRKIKIYDSNDKGIAFEIDSATGKGVAIVIHQPNDSPGTYINLH